MTATRRSLLTGGRASPVARVAIADRCLARRYIHCQSCADVCSEQAIRFTPRIGGPPLPRIDPARCTGCGDCFSVCPVSALAAVPDAARV